MSDETTPFKITSRDSQPYVAISVEVRMDSIHTVAGHLHKVFVYLASTNKKPTGPPFFRYRSINMASTSVIEAGVPIASEEQFSADNADGIISGVLPAGWYVETTYIGDPSELRQATQEMLNWAEDYGLQWDVTRSGDGSTSGEIWGSRTEWYETDPREEPDQSKWQTRLAFRLAKDPHK